MALKKLLQRAAKKAALKVAAKKAATKKLTAAAKKAALVAKSKKVAAAKKAGTLQKPSTRKRPQLSEAAKERQRVSAGQRKPATKAKSTIKVAPTKRTSTVKSKVKLSETLRRRQARRSSSGKAPVQGPKTKTQAQISAAQKDQVGTSKRQAAIKANKSTSKTSYTPTKTKVSAKTKRADSRKTLKTTESKGKSLTAAEKRRQTIIKLQDRGAKQVTKRTPKNSADLAQAARGDVKSGSRGDKETVGKRRTKRATQQKAIQTRRANQLEAEGRKQRKGRVQRLSAADARAAADDYIIGRSKEIKAEVSKLSGMEASRKRQQLTREMKRKAAELRNNRRAVSEAAQNAAKNNESPSVAFQEGVKNPIHQRNAQTRGERLSKDMTLKVSGSPVRSRRVIAGGTKSVGQGSNPVKPKTGANSTVSRQGPGVRAADKKLKPKQSTTTTSKVNAGDSYTNKLKPKRGMQELPQGKKDIPPKSRSTTGPSPAKQREQRAALKAKQTKADNNLKKRNESVSKPRSTSQRQQDMNERRSKQRQQAFVRKTAKNPGASAYDQFGRGTTTWSN